MPNLKIILSIVFLMGLNSSSQAQLISDIELRIKAVQLIDEFNNSNGSLNRVVKGKTGKGGYDDDYREFLTLFTQNAKHVNDLSPLNQMGTSLNVKTQDSEVSDLAGENPDYIMYWRDLYEDAPSYRVSPYYIEVDRSGSELKVRCSVVKEVVNTGILKFTKNYTYPYKGMKYNMLVEMVLEGDDLKIHNVSLSDDQLPIYCHIINVTYDGATKPVNDEILCRDNSLFLRSQQLPDANTWIFTGNQKTVELQFALPDYSEVKSRGVISSELQEFSNQKNPIEQSVDFKPKPWRFEVDYDRSLFSTGDISASFQGDIKANSSSISLILRKEWGSKKNVRSGVNFHLSSENSSLFFNIADISRSIEDVDPDNFGYERIVLLSDFSEEVNFSSLKLGLSVSKDFQLRQSNWWLGIRGGGYQSFAVGANFTNQCDINRSGYYEDLYGIVIDDNGIYDFGNQSLNGVGSLDQKINSQSVFSDLAVSYRTNVWSFHGFAGYRFVRLALGEVEDGIWYDSQALPSVLEQMDDVYWSSINIGFGITRRIAKKSAVSCN
jgi:hypothetical protein